VFELRISSLSANISDSLLISLAFSEKELAFLRILCSSQHEHISQDSVETRLVESEVLTPEEFKQVKKKLLYSGVIGIVYGNITIENREILDYFKGEDSI
jgi:TctA family transporter